MPIRSGFFVTLLLPSLASSHVLALGVCEVGDICAIQKDQFGCKDATLPYSCALALFSRLSTATVSKRMCGCMARDVAMKTSTKRCANPRWTPVVMLKVAGGDPK